jgi:DNA helicase-2/ATP-dependent DNA helicase PcrA
MKKPFELQPTGRLFGAPETDYTAGLNDEQKAVVLGGDGPCLVLAGAGSGKTRVIVHRVAHLIAGGVSPEEILLLTFTNKAAAEMMGRIGKLLGDDERVSRRAGQVGRVTGGTFHSVANRLLRQYAAAVGYTPHFTILDTDDQKTLLKAVIRDLGLDDKKRGELQFPSAAVVQSLLSYRTSAMRPLPDVVARRYPKFEPLLADLEHLAGAYAERKRQADAMDFDDLLLRFYELLETNPVVRDALGRRFRYVLVDEFQDTNPLQAAVVRLLTGGCGNVLAVGDDAQSIYSFRAAEVRNILDFTSAYPGARVFKLETNYRSTEEVLDLANDVISHNRNRFAKELVSVSGQGGKPQVVPAASAAEEAKFIARRIAELVEGGTSPDDVAVLFRATHHSQALEFEMMKAGLEYDYRGGVRFFDRAHVKDLLAFVRLGVNFRDEAAWLRALGLMRGVGPTTAAKIFALMMEAGSLAAALLAPIEAKVGKRAATGWRDLRACLEAVHGAAGKPAGVISGVRQAFYKDYLEGEYPDALDRLGDIRAFEEFASGYETCDDLLAEVTLDDTAFRTAGDRKSRAAVNRVVLSTVHQAKGLEWDAVFVMHLTDSGFPNQRAAEEEDGLEEERRLFYVAVTRAKRRLWLTYPMTSAYGSVSFELMSRFLSEADPHLLDWTLYEERMGAAGARRLGGGARPGSPFGSLVRRALAGEGEHSTGDFYEEPSVSVDDDGQASGGKGWRGRSFLGDY